MQDMLMLVYVLHRYEMLDKLLKELNKAGIKGATVLHSNGMAQILSKEDDVLFGILRSHLNSGLEDNRTLFMVLSREQVQIVRETIGRVIGPIDQPGNGVMFVLPVLSVEGITP